MASACQITRNGRIQPANKLFGFSGAAAPEGCVRLRRHVHRNRESGCGEMLFPSSAPDRAAGSRCMDTGEFTFSVADAQSKPVEHS